MPVTAAHIEARIRDALPDARITVQDTTGTSDHWAAVVVTPAFQGKSLVERHRLVYAALGELMRAEMKRWEETIPIVSDVRGRGLMLGFDLVQPGTQTLLDKATTKRIFHDLLERGVIAMIYNPEVRINPPLVIGEEQAMEALATMREVLRDTAQRISA